MAKGGKDPPFLPVKERPDAEPGRVRFMKMIDEEEVGESSKILQTICILRKNLDGPFRMAEYSLNRDTAPVPEFRMNDLDCPVAYLHTR